MPLPLYCNGGRFNGLTRDYRQNSIIMEYYSLFFPLKNAVKSLNNCFLVFTRLRLPRGLFDEFLNRFLQLSDLW